MPDAQLNQESISFFFILAFRPRPRHPQIVAQLVEVAHRRAVTQFESKLFLKPAMDFDPRPVKLSSLARIL